MKSTYVIGGMSCQSCVDTVEKKLKQIPGVESVGVKLNPPEATLTSEKNISAAELQSALDGYTVADKKSNQNQTLEKNSASLPGVTFATYRPLLLIVTFIFGVSILVQYPLDGFDIKLWMRHFMAGFFLTFSFFKLLNLAGFSSSYAKYDIIASRWSTWGYIYPFLELGLGIFYLINFEPFLTNCLTVIILGLSSIGVIQSNLNRRKIKCACLGDVFNLPMSTITIVEDLAMVGMALIMLL